MTYLYRLRDGFGRIPVRLQLFAAFTMMMLLTATVGGVALNGLSRVDAQADALAQKWLHGVGLVAELRLEVSEVRENEVKHSRATDASHHTEYEEKIARAGKRVGPSLQAYELLLNSDTERALFAQVGRAWAGYQATVQRVVAAGRNKKQQDAADFSNGAASMAFDEAIGALAKLTKYGFDGGAAAAERADAVYDEVKTSMIDLVAGALLLGLTLAYAISRQLLGQLGGEPRTAADVAKAVAEGDLTTQIQVKAGDTHSLMAQLAAMQQALTQAVTHVRNGSENVATASAEIAQGNQDLSSRTEQQAGALEETAATMDQLGATVRNNADNARQANQLALGASTVAVKGGAVVEQVVQTMKGINDSSRKIADITSVIDSIAFQTNILALNAAVEAARAGEQGRGFAVVASEVRNLAQRSADAAKVIKLLINASVERVAHGTALVDQAGLTMGEIVGAIKRVTDIMGEISAASTEQSSGVAQVGEAVSQMDRATQQNAALVEQSAAAAESMKQQAQQLVQAVAVFKLRAGATAAPAWTASAEPADPPAAHRTVERRGPNRATNVARLKAGGSARTGRLPAEPGASRQVVHANAGSDEWESF